MGNCMFLRKGEVHTAPVTGIAASTLAVGSTVKLMESGAAVEYLVVNQGKPGGSSLYDDSCDGTWLLRKACLSYKAWEDSSNESKYAESTINTWLNGDFFNTLGSIEQAAVKQAKIPYCISRESTAVNSGAKGLSVKAFLLGVYELGWTTSDSAYMPVDGAKCSYFISGTTTSARNRREAYFGASVVEWWTRSPFARPLSESGVGDEAWFVSDTGFYESEYTSRTNYIRPALILPKTALFDETTMILKGVA